MAGPILVSSAMKINRNFFAQKLQAFKEDPHLQKTNAFGFGMKVLENAQTRNHPILLSFKDVGEIAIPISKEVKLILHQTRFFLILFPLLGFPKVESSFTTHSQRVMGNESAVFTFEYRESTCCQIPKSNYSHHGWSHPEEYAVKSRTAGRISSSAIQINNRRAWNRSLSPTAGDWFPW